MFQKTVVYFRTENCFQIDPLFCPEVDEDHICLEWVRRGNWPCRRASEL